MYLELLVAQIPVFQPSWGRHSCPKPGADRVLTAWPRQEGLQGRKSKNVLEGNRAQTPGPKGKWPQRQVTCTFFFHWSFFKTPTINRGGMRICAKSNLETAHTQTLFIFNLFTLNIRLFLLTEGLFSHCFTPLAHRASLLNVNEGISHSPFAGMF